MKVILDYDHTLLDSEELKKALAFMLGVGWKHYQETYDRSIVGGNYDWQTHLKLLGKNDEFNQARVKKFLEKDIDSFLHAGVKELLESFNSRGYEMIMFTKGDPEWQRAKLKNSFISKFCQIHYEDKDKAKAMEMFKDIAKREKIIIINDNSREARAMKAMLPEAELYIVEGPYNDKQGEERIFTISELYDKFFPKEAKEQYRQMSGVKYK